MLSRMARRIWEGLRFWRVKNIYEYLRRLGRVQVGVGGKGKVRVQFSVISSRIFML